MKIIKISSQTVVFHGSKKPLDHFSEDQQVSGYYPGFYVTSELGTAKDFGIFVYRFNLSGNFYHIGSSKDASMLKIKANQAGYWTSNASGYQEAKYLKDAGYAGIRRGIEYIVFEPEKNLTEMEIINHEDY